jgi:hypothetical protein
MMSFAPQPSVDRERYNRRLSDKIQAAFDHACEVGELDVAADLLATLEAVLLRVPPKVERRETVLSPLIECYQRLWHLRHATGEPLAERADADAIA